MGNSPITGNMDTGAILRQFLHSDFIQKLKHQHYLNLKKWGKQSMGTLVLAAIEEFGEIGKALLGNPDEKHDYRTECIHLAALLKEIYELEEK